MGKTFIGTTVVGQSGTRSNGNKVVPHIHPNPRIGISPSDAVLYHTPNTHWEGVFPRCRGTVGVLYSPRCLAGGHNDRNAFPPTTIGARG